MHLGMSKLLLSSACLGFLFLLSVNAHPYGDAMKGDTTVKTQGRSEVNFTIVSYTLQGEDSTKEAVYLGADYTMPQADPLPFSPSSGVLRGIYSSSHPTMSTSSLANPRQVRISYVLPEEEWVQLEVSDVMGNRLCTLMYQTQRAGLHHFLWKGMGDVGSTLSPGVYFCSLRIGEHVSMRKRVHLFPPRS